MSKTITLMRLPLMVCVVLVHTVFVIGDNYTGYNWFKAYYGQLGSLAVPIFFVFSGYLFYCKTGSQFSLEIYMAKVKSRVKSLLVPYLLWNLAYLLFILLLQTVFPGLVGNARKAVLDYSLIEVLNSFWNYGGLYYGMPVLYAFWFIRNLMVFVVFSPLFLWLTKATKFWALILLGVLYTFNVFHLIPTDLDWLKSFFFFLGAYFAITGRSFILQKSLFRILGVVFVALIVLKPVLSYSVLPTGDLGRGSFIVASLVVPSCIYYCVQKYNWHLNAFLTGSAFFVYALHLFIIVAFNKFWTHILPVTSFTASLMYVLIPFLVSACCIGMFAGMRKLIPQTTKVLMGNR